jgi:NitT/TauT family transport system substrate-binding protein
VKKTLLFAAAFALAAGLSAPATAATSVTIGISGWTGFAPLTLADETGIFEKHGLDVTLKKIPQQSRVLAIASGDLQCAATTVETWIVWNESGVPTKQIFQLDKSYGADGIVARNDIKSVADLKGKSVAVQAPGTSPYFLLAWVLNKNGLSTKDVTVVNLDPGAAAQAFLAGQNDAAVTYEPYLSAVRDKPDQGHIIATTLDYPMVMDTVGCTPEFLEKNPDAAKALADSYFEALDMIKKEPEKSYEIMGADVKQSAKEFEDSAKYLRWADREENKKFFTKDFADFSNTAADLLLNMGLIKEKPDVSTLVDTSAVE